MRVDGRTGWGPLFRSKRPRQANRALSEVQRQRALRQIPWLAVFNFLALAALVCIDGENWVVRSPLFRFIGGAASVVGSLVTYIIGFFWWLVYEDWSVCEWSKALLRSFGLQPYRSALGLLLVCLTWFWVWWRYGGAGDAAVAEPGYLTGWCLALKVSLIGWAAIGLGLTCARLAGRWSWP